MNRTLSKFPFLGTAEEINRNYIPAGVGWKEYYIWLSDMALQSDEVLEELANDLRLDIQLLLGERLSHLPGGVHFTTPVLMSPNMLNFFRNADLGKVDPRDPNSANLKDSLYALRTGIASVGMLITLWHIYTKFNNMKEGTYLRATPEMYQYFQDTFRELSQEPQRYNRAGKPLPRFSPEKFKYPRLQSIINLNIHKDPRFDPSYEYGFNPQEILNNIDINQVLNDRQIVSNALTIHQEMAREN